MRWTNHVAVTGAVAYAITGDIWRASIAATGAVIPDWIEGREFNRKIHRTVSHWIPLYGIAFVISTVYLFMKHANGANVSHIFLNSASLDVALIIAVFTQYASIGAIMHVCEDALCGKVPLVHPLKRDFGLKLFTVGSAVEYVVSAVVLGVVVIFFR